MRRLTARNLIKPAVCVALAALPSVAYYAAGDRLSSAQLVRYESDLRAFLEARPVLFFAGAFVVYVAVTGLLLPGATAMTLLLGWLLGFWRAMVLVSFASTAGATLAMVLSRHLFRAAVEHRLGERLGALRDSWERDGPFYLFMMRLVPAIPFFVINIGMGLTPIRVRTFWWVSQLGMLPGTIVYVYAASAIPDLQTLAEHGARGLLTPQMAFAFVLLGLFPLAVRRLARRWNRTP